METDCIPYILAFSLVVSLACIFMYSWYNVCVYVRVRVGCVTISVDSCIFSTLGIRQNPLIDTGPPHSKLLSSL
jgi:hypothetical protein